MPEQISGEVSYNMAPYSGPWTKAEASHLLRRAMFGPTNQQLLDAVTNGMNATVTTLLQIPPINDPITYDSSDPISAVGTTWVNDVYPSDPVSASAAVDARNTSLAVWLMERINTETVSIAEKMTLFWQNHFAVPFSPDPRTTHAYHAYIRMNALGNFKQLVKDITIEPSMLIFLNGATNNQFSPNENYARELLELFTIGKGEQIGEGDYTNYKEEDVAAAAKILTGYHVQGLLSATATSVTSDFSLLLHDTSTKTLSSHFGNATVPNNAENEYADYIDIIFQQDEVANHICRKLYRYFVNYDLTADVETNVIPIMAATLIANNYDVLPVMTELLSSEHFYDTSVRGAQIKGPLEMLFSMINSTESAPNFDLETNSGMFGFLYQVGATMGQSYAEPPSVAGWPAYYQEPSYTQLWINATYLRLRFQIGDFMTLFTGIPYNGEDWKLDALTFLDGLSLPSDAQTVIDDIVDVFTPKGISPTDKLILKTILTNGLPDFEWTIEYNDYINNPGNTTYSDPVRTRVELVLSRVFQMPQFQTM